MRAEPGGHRKESAEFDEPVDEPPAQTVLEQMGGVSGLIYSSLPIVAFVPANSLWNLTVAIYAALAVALAIFVLRVVRREPIQPAISGVIGVAVCAFIAHRTGDAKGFFLFGIWTTLLYAGVFAVSILFRWPLVGVIWNGVNGNGTQWRSHRRTLLAYDIATAVWAALFGVRYLVQSFLYDNDQTGGLAVARIAMGWPLTAAAALATVLLVRWAHKNEDSEHEDSGHEVTAPPETEDPGEASEQAPPAR